MSDQTKSVVFRFVRGAIAGGVSALVVQFANNPVIDLSQKQVVMTLISAFVSGVLLAVDKMLRMN